MEPRGQNQVVFHRMRWSATTRTKDSSCWRCNNTFFYIFLNVWNCTYCTMQAYHGVPNKIHHSGSRLGRGTMKQLFVLYSSHRNRIMIPNHFRIFFTGLDRQDVKQKRNWASIWRLNFAIGAAAGENGGPGYIIVLPKANLGPFSHEQC